MQVSLKLNYDSFLIIDNWGLHFRLYYGTLGLQLNSVSPQGPKEFIECLVKI